MLKKFIFCKIIFNTLIYYVKVEKPEQCVKHGFDKINQLIFIDINKLVQKL